MEQIPDGTWFEGRLEELWVEYHLRKAKGEDTKDLQWEIVSLSREVDEADPDFRALRDSIPPEDR